eukprot:Nitzschia sp. Nitz4//scaffold119_size111653//42238//48064//NITZ4_004188-RA/size111653-augustus-gene-0.212-mRNA-1//1//CDS//3329533830//4604//frame0
MIQWKQRLYAFLLRRVLGPFLDASANQKLHDSVDVSLQEGRIVLKNIGLNASHISERLASTGAGVSIRTASVEQLEVILSLRENTAIDSNGNPTAQSSLVWRTMKLGTMSESIPAVSLVAEIRITGLKIELEIGNPVSPPVTQKVVDPVSQEPTSKSIIASYVDAALASLQLSLKLSNVSVRLVAPRSDTITSETFVAVSLSTLSLNDLEAQSAAPGAKMKVVLNKSMEVSNIGIQVGTSECCTEQDQQPTTQTTTVCMAQGSSKVFYRVFESEHDTLDKSKQNVQQDIDINLNQQLNVSLTQQSLLHLQRVAIEFAEASSKAANTTTDQNKSIPAENGQRPISDGNCNDEDSDREDLKALTGIMKQYREAYHLAANNQLRGGILVPSNAYQDETDEPEEQDVTFDVFFDANDQSFYHAASVLKASTMLQAVTDEGSIQSKIRLTLLSGCFKIGFSNTTHSSRPHEYILASVAELNVSAFSAGKLAEIELSVSHFEIEDSQIDHAPIESPRQQLPMDVATTVSFAMESSSIEEDDHELVVSQAPCISIHARRSQSDDGGHAIECDANLYPLQLCLRQRTLSNLSRFFSCLSQEDGSKEEKPDVSTSNTSPETTFSLACNCPSITVSLPVVRPVPTDPLFSRCGEFISGLPAPNASFNLLLDTVAVNFRQGSCDDESLASFAYFSCLNAIVFASAPVGGKVSINSSTQRVDIALFAGRTEVNPHIPLSFEYRKKKEASSADGSLGRSIFPIVPVISSFKARQEDEDDDRRIDRKDTVPVVLKSDGGDRKDPQIAMIAEAERSVATGSLRIPDVIIDLTRPELEVVLAMTAAVSFSHSSTRDPASPSAAPPSKEGPLPPMSFAVHVDKFTLSIKEDYLPAKPHTDLFSCLFATEGLRLYVQVEGSSLRNARIVLHNLCLYSALQPVQEFQSQLSARVLEQRIAFLKRRQRLPQGSAIVPILYRSQMFQPICDEAPSLIVDLRDQSNTPNAGPWETLGSIYFSLYHLSFRYEVEAAWMNRLKSLIPAGSPASSKPPPSLQTPSSMTKVFATVADCNVDYSTPTYFAMQSRSILRVGDLRFSSNFLDPPSRSQAFLVSLGDVSMNICNQKLPYTDEDGKLCRASLLLPFQVPSRVSRTSPKLGATSEALLRENGYIEVLLLDSMHATVSVTDWMLPGRKRVPRQDACTTTEVAVGLVTLGACKDSFNCFAETIGELQAKLTALSQKDLKDLVAKLPSSQTRVTSLSSKKYSSNVRNATKPKVPADKFLLDGYEWTGIDHTPDQELQIPDGDEQAATWYKTSDDTGDVTAITTFPSQIFHHHFPLQAVSHPLSGGDMGASKYVGENVVLSVKSRLLLHKMAVKVRLYDGYDWPEAMTENQKKVIKKSGIFAIEPLPREDMARVKLEIESEIASLKKSTAGKLDVDRKVDILSELLADQATQIDDSPFSSTPLPHDRAHSLKQDSELRRLKRRSQVCFQVSANGISARVDSYEETMDHRLASMLSVSVSNLYFAETTSQTTPVKMFGEWLNENQHPRDSRHGALMLKMTTSKPPQPTTDEGEIANDISEATVQLLPMRAIIDQRAIIFLQAFFNNDVVGSSIKDDWTRELHLVPPPQFKTFKVKPWKLKVDYMPQRMDVGALREGSVVELVNISPIDGMIITLSQVDIREKVGFGDVIGSLSGSWLQEVVSTQLHKFVANARPFEPISDVGQGISDLVVLPYEAFKNGDDIQRAMSKGFKSLAETVTFQALTTTSKLTEYAANRMAGVVGDRYQGASNPLPSRPSAPPRGMNDVTGHAMASLARGFQTANYKVVIVPYREYSRNGTTGAVSSVLRGVPVMLVAPVSGAAEALSYTLLGARNALRPDIRREEEASRTGFTNYDG